MTNRATKYQSMRSPKNQTWREKARHVMPTRELGEYVPLGQKTTPFKYENSTARTMNRNKKRNKKYCTNTKAKLFREIYSFEQNYGLDRLDNSQAIISEEARKLRYLNFKRIQNDEQKHKYITEIGNMNAIDVLAKFGSKKIKQAIAKQYAQ